MSNGNITVKILRAEVEENRISIEFTDEKQKPEDTCKTVILGPSEDGKPGFFKATALTTVYYSKNNDDFKEIHFAGHYSQDNTNFCIIPIFQLSPGYYKIVIRAGGIVTSDPLILLRKNISIIFEIKPETFNGFPKRQYPLSQMDEIMIKEKREIAKTFNISEQLVIGKMKFYCKLCEERFSKNTLFKHIDSHLESLAINSIGTKSAKKTLSIETMPHEAEIIPYPKQSDIDEIPTPDEISGLTSLLQ